MPGWRHVIVPRRAAGLCAAAAAAAAEGDGASAEPGQVSSRLLPARRWPAWGPRSAPLASTAAGRAAPEPARPAGDWRGPSPAAPSAAAGRPRPRGAGGSAATSGRARPLGRGRRPGRSGAPRARLRGEARPPWLPWTLPSHPHPAPARPLGPWAGPGGRLRGGLARTGLPAVGVCRPPAAESGVPGPPAAPRVAATSRPRAALGARGSPPHPHRTPQRDKLSHPAAPPRHAGPPRGAVHLAPPPSVRVPHAGRWGGAGTLEGGEEGPAGPGGASPKACAPRSSSLSSGQEEPTYLEGVGGEGDQFQMFEMKI